MNNFEEVMSKNNPVRLPKRKRVRYWLTTAALIVPALLGAGCAATSHSNSNALEESFTLPPFLAGPVAVLLTNANNFSARMVVDLPPSSTKTRIISGNLLGQQSHLFFAPTVGDRSFIWDATQNSGYILSEALQGCAPIASAVQITHVAETAGVAGPVLESVNGRPCHRTQAVISSSDGSTARFIVWRPLEADRFPARIKSMNGSPQLTINFFDARRESLAQKLFLPPDGFTKYATAETIRDELQMRQKAVGKKVISADSEKIPGVGHGDVPSQISR